MADQQDLKLITKRLEQIAKLYTKLGKINPFSGKDAKQVAKELGGASTATFALETNIKGLNAELIDASSGLRDITKTIGKYLEEIGVKGPTAFQSYRKNLRGIKSIASSLEDIQDNLGDASEKQINRLQKRNKLEEVRARRNINAIFEERKANLANEQEKEQFQNAQEGYLKVEVNYAKEIVKLNSLQSAYHQNELSYQEAIAAGNEKEKNRLFKKGNELLKQLDTQEKLTIQKGAERDNILHTLKTLGGVTDEELAALTTVEERKKAQADLNDALTENLRRVKNINKAQGLTGKIIKGLGNSLEKLGFGDLGLSQIQEDMKELAMDITENGDKAAGFGSKFRIMLKGLSEVGKNLAKNLTDPVIIIGLLVKGFKSLLDFGQSVAKNTAQIGQNFRGLGSQATEIDQNLRNIAASNPFLSVEEANEAFTSLNKELGTAVSFSEETVNNFKTLNKDLGLGVETTSKLFRISSLSGTEFGDIVAETDAMVASLNQANGLAINQSEVLEEIASSSASVRFNLGNNPKALAQAAYEAKKLGFSLNEIQGAAESTLDFESSIESQLTSQLMLGKNIDLTAYRRAALSGDTASQATELNKLIKEQGGDLEGNVLKQQQFAETLGISRDRLLEGLESIKLQEKFGLKGAKEREAAEKGIQRLMAEDPNLTREQAINKLTKERINSIAKASKESEVFSRSIESVKESFAASFAPVAKELAEKLRELVEGDGFEKIQKTAQVIGKVLAGLTSFAIENPLSTAVSGIGVLIAKNLMGLGKRGSSPMKPVFTSDITGGIGGLKNIFSKGKLGKTLASVSKQMTKIGVAFGSKKALGNVTQAVMKNSGKTVTGAAAKSAVKAGTAKIVGTKATSAAAKAASKSAGKTLAKQGGKAAAKTIGKSLLKKIPVIGLLAGAAFAMSRAAKGDYLGAMGELASGAVSLIPGVGTAASVAIDAGLAARDVSNAMGGNDNVGRGASSPPTLASQQATLPSLNDFISRPGEPIREFNKDDIIIGGTNLDGTNNINTTSSNVSNNVTPPPDMSSVEKLLERLITTVERGGDVYIDGNKAGTALGMASYRTQ